MNQPASPATRKTTMWIAIAVAGVAFVAAGSYIFDIPPSASNVAGTVQPAQRYRAEQQLTAQDVKLADQTLAQALQSDVVVKLIKDPQFQALARSPAALSALAVNAWNCGSLMSFTTVSFCRSCEIVWSASFTSCVVSCCSAR